MKYEHFKMDDLDKAVKMMRKNRYMASTDSKDAYYSVAIHQEHRNFLIFFRWDMLSYQFLSVPYRD